MTVKHQSDQIFTPELRARAEIILGRYAQSRAALLPLLHLIQETYGYVSTRAEIEVAEFLGIPPVDVREVITFYTLYRTKPCAKNQLNVCRTLSCVLMGAEDMIQYLEQKLGIRAGEETQDGKFSLNTVECLGACEIAPMMQCNKEYVGPLSKEKIDELLKNQ